jgi:hypothetical protein
LLLTLGCGGYQGIRAAQLTPFDAHWERILQRQARTELACRSVRLIPLGESVMQADGCMRVAEYALFCSGRRRCDWRMLEGVGRHAERDLACPVGAVSISAPGPLQRNALGCGRATTYTLTCSAQHCTWTPSAPAATGPAPVEVVAVTSGTDGAAIPPPPGSTADPGAPAAGAAGSTDDVVIPPPPGSTPPPSTTGGTGTDEVVIPPPPT